MVMDQYKIKFFMATQNALEGISNTAQKAIVREYYVAMRNVKNQISSFYEKYADKDGKLPLEEMQKFNRLQKFEQSLNLEISNLQRNANKLTKQAIFDSYMESFYRYGYMIESDALIPLSYGLITKDKLDAVLYNPLDLIKWSDRHVENNTFMVRQVREELMKGMVQGLSYDKVAKAVQERVNIGANKAIRIVQTETHRSSSEGTQNSMDHAVSKGVQMKKRWVSTLDSKTRDSHRSMDGQEVAVDEQFRSKSGRKAMSPSHFGDPKEDVNCRCTMISVFEGLEPSKRKARPQDGVKGEIIPYTDYSNWRTGLKK